MCVRASNKPKEARELLLQIMERFAIDEPNDPLWYAFGMVADAYGDIDWLAVTTSA